MIRVVHVVTRTNIGGVSAYLATLLEGSKGQTENFVIRGSSDKDEGDYFEHRDLNASILDVPTMRRGAGVIGDIRSCFRLWRIFRQLSPDVVHTHMSKAGVLGRIAAFFAGVPVRVHTFHGHLLYGYFSKWLTKLVVLIERLLRPLTSHAITNGESVRKDLASAGILRMERSSMIPPAVEEGVTPSWRMSREALGIPLDVPVVGFVGRLAPVKRPDRVLDLAKRIPDAHFALVGDGPLRGELERVAEGLENVSFHGWALRTLDVMPAFDVLVLPSDNEAIAVVLMEAAIVGVSIVAMNVGSVGEIVHHGETGILATDLASLESGIRLLLADDTKRRAMLEAARSFARRSFTTKRLVQSHIDLYHALMTGRLTTG